MKVAYSPEYILKLPEKHPFPIEKYKLLPEILVKEAVIKIEDFFVPERIDPEILALTHTKEYIYKVLNMELSTPEIKKIGFPLTPQLIERELIITQGTIDCCEFAFNDGVAFNIAGGTHHSYSDSGSGFCIFNDVAVASNYLINKQIVENILIVDLDVHQGNGNAKIFENNHNVFTFSMHGEKNFPLKKEVSKLDIALADNTEDEIYLDILYKYLPEIIANFSPQIIFFISGVDILKGDRFGRLAVSIEGCKKRDEFVLRTAKKNNIPVVTVMGGGYSKDIDVIVKAHCNTYRAAKEIYD